MSARIPCDCTCLCGDDGRVAKGTVQPCADWLAAKERELEAMRLDDMQRATGYAGDAMGTLLELQRLRGERGVMLQLFRECLAVLADIEPEDDGDATLVAQLRGQILELVVAVAVVKAVTS
jgi:hypothetical protein